MQILDFFHTTFAFWLSYLFIGIVYANHVDRQRKEMLNEYKHRLHRYMGIRNDDELTLEQKQKINQEIKRLDEEFAHTVKTMKILSTLSASAATVVWIGCHIITILLWPAVWLTRRFK